MPIGINKVSRNSQIGTAIPDSGGYLYDSGNLESYWENTISESSGEANKLSDRLQTVANGGAWNFVTEVAIDLSDYNSLEFSWTGYTQDSSTGIYEGYVEINDSKASVYRNTGGAEAYVRRVHDFDETETIDLSSISGSYYIHVYSSDLESRASTVELRSMQLI